MNPSGCETTRHLALSALSGERFSSLLRSQSPEDHSGLSDTKRRLRNTFRIARVQVDCNRTLVLSDARRARELNPGGCKPLDVSQTPSSTHWQHPPKRSSAMTRFYAPLAPPNEFGQHFWLYEFHFGTSKKARPKPCPQKIRVDPRESVAKKLVPNPIHKRPQFPRA